MGRRLSLANMKEHHVEEHLCKRVKNDLKGIPYKFKSPQRRSVPDRMCVLPFGHMFFYECKRPGEEPTPQQYAEMERLEILGHWVYWGDTRDKVNKVIDFWIWKLREEML